MITLQEIEAAANALLGEQKKKRLDSLAARRIKRNAR
jgi:hypothetical protein